MRRLVFLILAQTLAAAVAEETSPTALKRYDEGPLTASDFQAAVPRPRPVAKGIPLVAYTSFDLRYEMRYQGQVTPTRVTVKMTSIDVHAVFDRSKSWNHEPSSPRLLDHEQGHFDLAAVYARRLQLEFLRQIRSARGITGTGRDRDQALADMQTQIDRPLREALDALLEASREYDRVTDHGTKPAEQRQQRAKQREQLAQLADQLLDLER